MDTEKPGSGSTLRPMRIRNTVHLRLISWHIRRRHFFSVISERGRAASETPCCPPPSRWPCSRLPPKSRPGPAPVLFSGNRVPCSSRCPKFPEKAARRLWRRRNRRAAVSWRSSRAGKGRWRARRRTTGAPWGRTSRCLSPAQREGEVHSICIIIGFCFDWRFTTDTVEGGEWLTVKKSLQFDYYFFDVVSSSNFKCY